MTRIRMDWKNLRLELKGHAGSAPRGQDMVCCAESILSQTLIRALEHMEIIGRTGLDWTGSSAQGYLLIDADPGRGHEAEVKDYFRFAVTGLQMLADAYPEFIEIREDGKDGIS